MSLNSFNEGKGTKKSRTSKEIRDYFAKKPLIL